MEAEADAPTGETVGGITLADVFRRLIAGIEGVGLEEGDRSTTLTWNLNQRLAALLEVLNEPELYGPLKDGIQDDSLRQLLSDRVNTGDDLTFALRYVHKGSAAPAGSSFRMIGRAAAFERYRSLGSLAGLAKSSQLSEGVDPVSLMQALDPCSYDAEEMREDLSELAAAVMNVPELEARIYYRRRDNLVGPGQLGFSAKYTLPFGSVNSEEGKDALVEMMRMALRTDLSAEQARAAVSDRAKKAMKRLQKQQRFSFQVSFDESDEYRFTSVVPGLGLASLERSRALVGTAAYSLEFPSDNEDPATRPRYEMQLSYEDVDNDPARQNRLLARAIVSKRLALMGEATDLTFGLVYANKPEFLAQEDDIDEQLSARLGLSFKFGSGSTGGNRSGEGTGR